MDGSVTPTGREISLPRRLLQDVEERVLVVREAVYDAVAESVTSGFGYLDTSSMRPVSSRITSHELALAGIVIRNRGGSAATSSSSHSWT